MPPVKKTAVISFRIKRRVRDGLLWTVHPFGQRLHPRARRMAGFRVDVFARQVERVVQLGRSDERWLRPNTAPGQAATMKIRDVTTVLGHANCITCLIWNHLNCSPIRPCFLTRCRFAIHRAGISVNSLLLSVSSFPLNCGLVVVNFRSMFRHLPLHRSWWTV